MRYDTVYCEDSLSFLNRMGDESVDMFYVDPPFFSKRNYKQKNTNIGFSDTWKDIETYLKMITERLVAAKRVLKKTGSIFVHLDHRAVHHAGVAMDREFGHGRLVNEIIWYYSAIGNGRRSGHYKRRHHTILHYSKSKEYCGTPECGPLADSTIKQYRKVFDSNGNVTVKHIRENSPGYYRAMIRGGRLKADRPDDYVIMSKDKGTVLGDVWSEFNPIRSNLSVFPTQKPLALLERMVSTASKKGDLVADFFCGSGTALVAAKKLGRRYVGCDISEDAVSISKGRLA